MSKFQDLLNGKIPEYSGAIIIPDEDRFKVTAQDPKGRWVEVSHPCLVENYQAIEFSKVPRGYVAVGYPFFDGHMWRWRVWA